MPSRITCDGHYEQVEFSMELLHSIATAIEKATIQRPEFLVDLLSTNGEVLASLHMAHAWSLQPESNDGWCLTLSSTKKPSNARCLSSNSSIDTSYGVFTFCGAEHEILRSCVLDWAAVAEAVLSLTTDLGSVSTHNWMPSNEVFNLDAVAAQFGVTVKKE